LCFTGIVYAREVGGQEFTFGVSGKLIRNVLVMYDRQTESLWSQLLGEAIEGELQGAKLAFLPSWHTTWRQWKELHPDTLALRKGFRGNRDPYDSYYRSSSPGIIAEKNIDQRLARKEFVLGVELDGAAIAYPFRVLNNEPVINDMIAGQVILVTFDRENASGIVFDRQRNDQTLSFEASDGDPFTLLDKETNSSWDALSGLATAGPLAGEQLERIKSTTIFWFGWTDFHPDTKLYGIEESQTGLTQSQDS
jgi:hypothetical protein